MMCVWQSIRPGSTVACDRSMTLVPAGIFSALEPATRTIRPARTTMTWSASILPARTSSSLPARTYSGAADEGCSATGVGPVRLAFCPTSGSAKLRSPILAIRNTTFLPAGRAMTRSRRKEVVIRPADCSLGCRPSAFALLSSPCLFYNVPPPVVDLSLWGGYGIYRRGHFPGSSHVPALGASPANLDRPAASGRHRFVLLD